MSRPDQILDVLQADIVAVLKSTPALSDAYVFTGTEKDFATRLAKSLGTRTASTAGKRGLAIQVLPIFVTDAESNLPGPPLKLKCQMLAVENVRLNRAGETGTLRTSSQAALDIIGSLHQLILGGHILFAEKNPIAPEKMEDGFEANLVTVYCRANGIQGPGKPLGVEAAMVAGGNISVAGTMTPDITGELMPAGVLSGTGEECWSSDGNQTPPATGWWTMLQWIPDSGVLISAWLDTENTAQWWSMDAGQGGSPSMDIRTVSNFVADPGAPGTTGSPEISIGSSLALTCATPSAAIYYTTDGSYPAPIPANLYSAPITGLLTGTIVRAAAYKTGLNPGDVLELTVTD